MDEEQLIKKKVLDRKYRNAFFTVVEAYNQIKATLGNAPAIDYFQSQLGKAKFKCDVSFLRAIDYLVDADRTAESFLNSEQLRFYKEHYIGQPDRSAVSDRNMMLIQRTLGKAFITRKLWPLSEYFAGSKAQ